MLSKAQFFRVSYSLTALCAVALLVWQFGTRAETAEQAKQPAEMVNYDIRTDRGSEARTAIAGFIGQSGKTPDSIKLSEKSWRHAAERFREDSAASIRIENKETLNIPETISPETALNAEFLTRADNAERSEILRGFLRRYADLFGLTKTQISRLKTSANYTNPDGNLSFVRFEQKINEIPVFQGEVKAGLTKRGEIIRIINNLAPNIDDEDVSDDFGNPRDAVFQAAKHIGIASTAEDVKTIVSTEEKITFERGQFFDRTTAEKFYFPIAHGVVRTAWRVLLWTEDAAFYVVVDARDGTLLWRKSITEKQTQTATFNVYGNTSGFMRTEDSPAPFTPGCIDPNNCPQPPAVNRQSFTLIGNEPPYSFDNNGWIPDGENRTIGNAAEAGIDRDGVQGIDPNGWAFGNPNRSFIYAYNPAPGIPPPGEEPLPTTQTYPPSPFQQGSVTHAFYAVNRWHDETYRLGFNEQARNFQTDNFGRGGTGNDSISVEVQDGSGTNGANFSTPADGARPRLQLFVWTGTTPARDGALDSQIAIHEVTHGLSNRLHGNATGLSGNMARSMGEGWSDFYALALLSDPSDDPFGIYSVGCYSVASLANCYYGLRRFPVARRSVTGPNGFPHNPLKFGNLNAGNCSVFNSAYPRGPIGTNICDQVFNAGEIWSLALWEVRGFLIDAHGAAEGNRRALQYITDGMKLSPLNPTMLQARDAIIAAAQVGDPADTRRVWRGFATRGIGFSAVIVNPGTGNNNTVVTEAFDTPNVAIGPGFVVSDTPGNNNGYPEPGETIRLTIPLVNNTGAAVTGVTLQVAGGASAFYGDIQSGQTISQDINFIVPSNAPCPANFVLTFNINSSEGQRTETRTIFLGVPVGGYSQNFDSVTAPALPAGWATNNAGAGPPALWITTQTGPDTAPNSAFTNNPATVGESSLETPPIAILSQNANVSFRLKYATEASFDGLVLEIKIGSGPYTDIVAAGGAFTSNGYNGTLSTSFQNPLAGRMAWTGNSTNYLTVAATLPASANGQKVQLRWRMGSDNSVAATGVNVDTITLTSGYTCGDRFLRSRADFDGDGRTDISVFRPSEGNWYLNRSNTGLSVINWGIATDKPAPGDYDGDGKTDVAVFRPAADSGQPDFYVLNSLGFTFSGYSWGLPNDLATVEDYDGDGRDDIAVFRPSSHTFYVLKSGTASLLTFANITSGVPAPGDFDGDGKADFASYSFDGWYLAPSNINYGAVTFTRWGASGDKPVAADYDGDLRDDFAVFRPSNQTWYIRKSSGGTTIVPFGSLNDIPVPGDYDGDGRADIAVYRDGTWYINRTTSGILITQFGLATDLPVPNAYFP